MLNPRFAAAHPAGNQICPGASQDFLPQKVVIFAGPGFGFHRASISLLSAPDRTMPPARSKTD
jgi:hypothetical protein